MPESRILLWGLVLALALEIAALFAAEPVRVEIHFGRSDGCPCEASGAGYHP